MPLSRYAPPSESPSSPAVRARLRAGGAMLELLEPVYSRRGLGKGQGLGAGGHVFSMLETCLKKREERACVR